MKMKKLILILLFSTVMFSSSSYAGWTKVLETDIGDTAYVDFERIREHYGYVYWWGLTDFLKPTSRGWLSYKIYYQGDCKLFRHKNLSFSFHKEPMGGGTGRADSYPDEDWTDPAPRSGDKTALELVCDWRE